MASNLAAGAAYKHRKGLPPIIPSYTLPDIRNDAIIIGICGVPVSKVDIIEDGWFLSDFCAFNYLLKGLGSYQSWISVASEESLLTFFDNNPEHQPGFLHGNPFKDRQIVFSRKLIESKELTPFKVQQPTTCISAISRELQHASALSRASSPPRPIILFIFGHGTPSLGVLMNYEAEDDDPSALLRFDYIESLIGSNIPTTVVTTACFSGGWAIQPNVDMTILTAAGAKAAEGDRRTTDLSKSWPVSNSISRACGSIFASTLIETLTTSTTPLLDASSQDLDSRVPQTQLQPEKPNAEQSETFNSFCKTIHGVLGGNMTRRPDVHEFRFAAQDDEWVQCWMARTGVPLSHFANRWDKLSVFPSTQENTYTNLDPNNIYDPANTGAIPIPHLPLSQTGSWRQNSGPLDPPAHHSLRALRIVAQEHAGACLDDWSNAVHLPLRGSFQRFAKGEKVGPRTTEEKVINTLVFRDQLAKYTDFVVAYFNLPKAQGKTVLYWDSRWSDYVGCLKERTEAVGAEMSRQGLTWEPTSLQGYPFYRAHWYLAECIAMTDLDEAGISALVKDIKKDYDEILMHTRRKLMKSKRVRSRANDWFKSIGRATNTSSPAKSKRASLQNIVNMGSQ